MLYCIVHYYFNSQCPSLVTYDKCWVKYFHSYKVLSVEWFNVCTNLITVSNLLAKTDPKVQLITNNFPLHNIHNIWDPSHTVHPSTCTQRSTFTQTHWHGPNAQVLTTFLLHSCARRQDSINNLFEWDPVGFSVWNFEHPGIVLYSITIFRSYPEWSVPLNALHWELKHSIYLSVCQQARAFNGLQVPANKGQ